ncbi:MAG: hypothetical protein U1F36_01745 [Planctomycetota bacterium]
MSLHVATDPFQPIARGRAIVLIVGFVLAIAMGPALWFGGARVKTRSTPPPPQWDRSAFLDGDLTAKLDRYLVESSPVTRTIRDVYGDLWMCLGLLEPKGVVFGRGGFLFLRSTLGEPFAFRRDAASRREAFADLHREATELGVHVLVLPVPDKARVYSDCLFPQDARGPARAALYGEVLAELRGVGFEVLDLDAAMSAWRKARPEELLFQRLDTHWSLEAGWRTAELCAQRLDALGWIADIPRADVGGQPVQHSEAHGDLVSQTGLSRDGLFHRLLREEVRWSSVLLRQADGSASQPAAVQPDAVIAIAGDSFAEAGLMTALIGRVGRIVDAGGVKPSRGSREGVTETLARIRRGELHARVLIWEAVERSFDEGWWAPR